MTRTCPNCGTPAANDTARHCHECGTPLDAPGAPAGEAGPGAPPPPPAPHGSQQPYVRPAQHPSGLTSESRNWAMATHLTALLGGFAGGLPAFVGPLVIWLMKRDQDGFIAEHAKEALNFNLSVLLYALISFVLSFILIGIPFLIAIGIAWLVLTIMAAIRASNGEGYRYPLTIRFVS